MATNEETLTQELLKRFPFLEGKVRVSRPRRVWVETPLENFAGVFNALVQEMEFRILCIIHGLD